MLNPNTKPVPETAAKIDKHRWHVTSLVRLVGMASPLSDVFSGSGSLISSAFLVEAFFWLWSFNWIELYLTNRTVKNILWTFLLICSLYSWHNCAINDMKKKTNEKAIVLLKTKFCFQTSSEDVNLICLGCPVDLGLDLMQ